MELQTVIQLPVHAISMLAAMDTSMDLVNWLSSLFLILVAIGSLGFWYKAFVRLKNKQELIAYRRSECVLGFVDLLAIFAVWLGSQIAIGVLVGVLMAVKVIEGGGDLLTDHGVLVLYLSAGIGLASLMVAAGFLFVRYGTTNSFGLRFNQVGKQVGNGIVVFMMLFPPMLLLQYLLSLLVKYDHPVLSILADDPSFISIFSCWAAAVLAAPFVEEFVFRGVFHHWLERLSVSNSTDSELIFGGASVSKSSHIDVANLRSEAGSVVQPIPTAELVRPNEVDQSTIGDANPYKSPYAKSQLPEKPEPISGPKYAYWPILVSSLCFALVHFGQGLAPIPLFFLAVGLGYLFRQTGSLIACITVHFLLNFYSMLVFTILILLGETP